MGAEEKPLIVLFDDGRGQFGPMTDLRASFEVRTARFSAVESIRPDALWTNGSLAPIVAERHQIPVNDFSAAHESVVLVNGRIRADNEVAKGLAGVNRVVVEQASGDVVMAWLRVADARRYLESGELPSGVEKVACADAMLFARPWHILEPEGLARRLAAELVRGTEAWTHEAPPGVEVIGNAALSIHPDARIMRGCIIDLEHGAVTIDAGAIIRPGAVLVGPTFVGKNSIVAERSLLKARCVIGPHCRVAGEIGNTIFQGYGNKAHDGHLGDSLIGEWVNLGAGTTNSNLLNTYGTIALRLEADGPLERSGCQFLGAIIGDHVKTAILTRLPTGCVIGTGSMIATTAFAPSLVPRFAWLTDDGQRLYRFEKFIEVARAVWKRRAVEASPAMIEALRCIHQGAAK